MDRLTSKFALQIATTLLLVWGAFPATVSADCIKREDPFQQITKLESYVNRVDARLLQASSKEEYCERAADLRNFQAVLANDDTNTLWYAKTRLGFRNRGKWLFGEGVCWWHSQLTRSAAYLTIVRPLKNGESQMTEDEVAQAIEDLLENNKVVEIRGFENFGGFTEAYEPIVQKKLERYATVDYVSVGWARLIEGRDELKASELKKIMDQTYEDVETKGRIVYQKWKMKEEGTHSWLVIGVEKKSKPGGNTPVGYTLKYIDSNSPEETKSVDYYFGDTKVDRSGGFVPYTQRNQDFNKIAAAILSYCRPQRFEELLRAAASNDNVDSIVDNYKRTGWYPYLPKLIEDDDFTLKKWPNLMATP